VTEDDDGPDTEDKLLWGGVCVLGVLDGLRALLIGYFLDSEFNSSSAVTVEVVVILLLWLAIGEEALEEWVDIGGETGDWFSLSCLITVAGAVVEEVAPVAPAVVVVVVLVVVSSVSSALAATVVQNNVDIGSI
jgi:hypothetical protein